MFEGWKYKNLDKDQTENYIQKNHFNNNDSNIICQRCIIMYTDWSNILWNNYLTTKSWWGRKHIKNPYL